MSWLHNEVLVEEIDPKYIGFVYIITNLTNNKQYIGKKMLKFRKTKTVKGKKKGYYVESDWKTYFGSNEKLKEEVQTIGEENFKREILRFCKTKGELSYFELREQIDKRVLESDSFYNEWIFVKVRKSHIKNLILES